MKKEELIQAYHNNNLTAEQERSMEQMIASGEISLEELDTLSIFESIPAVRDVSDATDMKIIDSLESLTAPSSIKNPLIWYKYGLITLSAIILLVAAFWFGQISTNTTEVPVQHFQQDFASQFSEANNATEKISLVSTENLDLSQDYKIAESLIFALNNDKSTNVRIACVQTLENYSYLEQVRTGLVNSIINQNSPLVLSHIADAINSSGKGISKGEFSKRINKDLPKPLLENIEENFLKI